MSRCATTGCPLISKSWNSRLNESKNGKGHVEVMRGQVLKGLCLLAPSDLSFKRVLAFVIFDDTVQLAHLKYISILPFVASARTRFDLFTTILTCIHSCKTAVYVWWDSFGSHHIQKRTFEDVSKYLSRCHLGAHKFPQMLIRLFSSLHNIRQRGCLFVFTASLTRSYCCNVAVYVRLDSFSSHHIQK